MKFIRTYLEWGVRFHLLLGKSLDSDATSFPVVKRCCGSLVSFFGCNIPLMEGLDSRIATTLERESIHELILWYLERRPNDAESRPGENVGERIHGWMIRQYIELADCHFP